MRNLVERARMEAINQSLTCGDLFDELANEIERLMVENFTLAAGQCVVKDGLKGDEYGNQYCRLATVGLNPPE